MGFFWRHCSGKGTQLALRGESHGFSRVVVGSLGFFSSLNGDLRDALVCVREVGSLLELQGARRDSSQVSACK